MRRLNKGTRIGAIVMTDQCNKEVTQMINIYTYTDAAIAANRSLPLHPQRRCLLVEGGGTG